MLNQCFHKRQRLSFKNVKTVDANNEEVIPMLERHQSSDGYKKIIDRELSGVIEKAIMHIPPDYRAVFLLRELNGMSTAETAESLDISEANMKIRLKGPGLC